MKSKYAIALSMVNEDAEIDFTCHGGEDDCFAKTNRYYNSLDTRNIKRISNFKITGKHSVSFELTSDTPLQVPTKAIATWTRRLLQEWNEVEKYAVGSRIFKGDFEDITGTIVDTIPTVLSEVEALKLLMEIFVNRSAIDGKEKALREKTVREVKEVLLNYLKEGDCAL